MLSWRMPIGFTCMVGIIALNVVHVLVHGSPLDGGSLDAFFLHANAFLSANLNTD